MSCSVLHLLRNRRTKRPFRIALRNYRPPDTSVALIKITNLIYPTRVSQDYSSSLPRCPTLLITSIRCSSLRLLSGVAWNKGGSVPVLLRWVPCGGRVINMIRYFSEHLRFNFKVMLLFRNVKTIWYRILIP